MNNLKSFMLLMLMMVVCGATLSAQLGPGEVLREGEFLGLNGKIEFNQSKLVLESDGNIRVYCKGTEKWSSNTGGSGGNVLRMQNDGNLVLYKNNSSQSHDAVWSSGTYEIFGTNAEKLRFKYLGFEVFSEELCIFASKSCFGPNANPNANGTAMWSLFHNGQWAANGSNGFKTNNKLPWVTGPSYEYTTKDLVSPRQLPLGSSSTYEFTKGSVMQGYSCDNGQGASLWFENNGNMVLYWNKGSNYEEKLWESGTANRGGNVLRMQGDGNLVMYKNNGTQPNDAVWSSGTNNQTCPDECSYTFRMQNECDKKSSISLFINKSSKYNGRGEDIWKMYGN